MVTTETKHSYQILGVASGILSFPSALLRDIPSYKLIAIESVFTISIHIPPCLSLDLLAPSTTILFSPLNRCTHWSPFHISKTMRSSCPIF